MHARFLCMFRPPPPPYIGAHDLNQMFQGWVLLLYIGIKHLVGLRYAGYGLLHRPKYACSVQLCTLLSHTAILGLPPAPPIEVLDASQSFQGRAYAIYVGSKHLVGFRYACGRLLHGHENSILPFKWPFYPLHQTPICMLPPAAHIEVHEPKPSYRVIIMLSIAAWNFWLGSNRLARGLCICSKLTPIWTKHVLMCEGVVETI